MSVYVNTAKITTEFDYDWSILARRMFVDFRLNPDCRLLEENCCDERTRYINFWVYIV